MKEKWLKELAKETNKLIQFMAEPLSRDNTGGYFVYYDGWQISYKGLVCLQSHVVMDILTGMGDVVLEGERGDVFPDMVLDAAKNFLEKSGIDPKAEEYTCRLEDR